ncbi:MAG: hypothetical protein ACXIUM_13750 [Wenzhouxiangella sp.]
MLDILTVLLRLEKSAAPTFADGLSSTVAGAAVLGSRKKASRQDAKAQRTPRKTRMVRACAAAALSTRIDI